MNVQVTCNADLTITHCCAHFPGSTHHTMVLWNSTLPVHMEIQRGQWAWILDDVITDTDVLCKVKREEKQYLKTPQYTDEGEKNNDLSSGFPFSSTDDCLRQDEATSIFIDHLGVEVGEGSSNTSKDDVSGLKIVSFCIKGEEEDFCMDHHDSQRIESFSSPFCDGTMRRSWKNEENRKCTGKIRAHKDASEKKNVFQRSELGTQPKKQMWSETIQKQRGRKRLPYESCIMTMMHSTAHEGIHQVESSDTEKEFESDMGKSVLVPGQQNMLQDWRQFLNIIPDQSMSYQDDFLDNPKTCRLERPYQCNVCDKSFSRKQHFIGHQRTHTGERPYRCNVCGKSFSQMHNLSRHKRAHIGKKPYQCTECGKSFSRKDNLIGHQRVHIGERPYECTECLKKFSQKQNLIRHLRIHM
ncbi:zinc finger protein 180-like isoform X2 [Ambystoma mexicanum]|uniref:zinc finger protein 180-like isoform X2 n=1 Tax=Ambystoma mexicanum TaxID=8296 RepID=UPI0037E957D6